METARCKDEKKTLQTFTLDISRYLFGIESFPFYQSLPKDILLPLSTLDYKKIRFVRETSDKFLKLIYFFSPSLFCKLDFL